MVDRTSFGFETNVADVVDGIDLTGKCILITGGSAGLGAKAAEVFLADCQIAPFGTDPYEFHTVNPYAQDDENAEKLWAVSEEYVGQQFSY